MNYFFTYVNTNTRKHAIIQPTMRLNIFGGINAAAYTSKLTEWLLADLFNFDFRHVIGRVNYRDIQSLQLFSIN